MRESKYKSKSNIPGQLPIFRGVVHFRVESPNLVIRNGFLISDNELEWIISYYYQGKLPKCHDRNNLCIAVRRYAMILPRKDDASSLQGGAYDKL